MRALVCPAYGPVENLEIRELPAPDPGAGQVQIKVRAAGLNFPDLLSIAGQYQLKLPPPFVPGAEIAGVVTATGTDVRRVKAGDAVIAMPTGGAFADVCVADEINTVPKPESLSFEEAAGFAITYFTTMHAYRQSAQLQPGETVLVLGAAGGVGSAAVELGKAMGARVIAAASTSDKLEFAKALGADEIINYAEQPLKEAVKALTDGKGVDVVYDPVGGELSEDALRATGWHGRYLVIGFASGKIPALPANLALLKEASIVGVWWGTWAGRHPQEQFENMQTLAALLEEGKIRPRVSACFALEDYVAAFRSLSERRATGKIVFTLE